MQPLIDGDILVYEIGWAADVGWRSIKEWKEGDVPLDPPPFDYVAELLDNRIAEICGCVMATQPPIIYLTGKGNFREAIAKRKPYKGTRKEDGKPWHYANIWAYLQVAYNGIIVEGMEADDAMCIEQMANLKLDQDAESGAYNFPYTVICTRDKDLRQCSGFYYSWELGKQPAYGPKFHKGYGELCLSEDNKKLSGYGDAFFYAQCLMGDSVDNIPGLPKCGPKYAYDALSQIDTKENAYLTVLSLYRHYYGELAESELLEQARLLYMIREKQDNRILFWNPPHVNYEDWYDLNTKQVERIIKV